MKLSALKEGTVTLTHTYWYYGEQKETFTVTVSGGGEAAAGTTRVYVYVKLDGEVDVSDWTANKSGWFTVGYIDVPGLGSLPIRWGSSDTSVWATDAQWALVTALVSANTVVRHTANSGIALDYAAIKWSGTHSGTQVGLKAVPGGADDYAVSGTTWHLDGYLTVRPDYNVKVTYSYCEGDAESEDRPQLPENIDSTVKAGDPFSEEWRTIDGYVAVCDDGRFNADNPISFDRIAGNKDIHVVFHRDANGNGIPDCEEKHYTVTYEPGEHGEFEKQITKNILYGMPTPKFVGETTGADGWEFDGWDSTVSSTVTGNATYTAKWKQTKFTVTYDLDGGLIPGDDTQVRFECAKDAITPQPAAVPIKWGFAFTGWSPEVASTVTADVTYTAQWEAFKYHLEIAADTTDSVYDGNERSGALASLESVEGIGYAVKVQAKENGKIFYITGYEPKIVKGDGSYGTATDAGIYTVVPVKTEAGVKVYDENGDLYLGKHPYEISVQEGTHEIKPRPLSLASATLTKAYDGKALANANAADEGVTASAQLNANGLATESGWVKDEGATYSFDNSQTLVGEKANAFTVTAKEGTDLGNYEISKTEGKLVVTRKSIDETPNLDDGTVTPVLDVNYVDSVVYNGQDQTPTMIVIDRDNKNTLTSADYTVEFQRDGEMTGDLTTAGPITIVITGRGNYEGEITRSFEITRRPVTITAGDASKVFGTSDPDRFGASVAYAVNDGFKFQYPWPARSGRTSASTRSFPRARLSKVGTTP